VPSRVADAIAARVERLDRPTRDILRVASVEGGTFTAEVVAGVLGLDPLGVTSALGNDLDRAYRLVAAVDVERGPAGLVSRYRFRHDLIQRYVYDAIDPGERAYLHERVATALEALLGEGVDPVALAFHYASAHAPARAAGHHRKAGDQARQAHALDQAIEHYRAALAAWPDRDPLTRAALLRDLGEVEADRLRYADAMRYLGEASAAFEAAGDPRSAASALVDIARFVSFTGFRDYAGMFDAVGRAIALLEPLGESAELADALSFLSYGHTWIADFAEGAALGKRAVAMAERVGARDALPIAMISLGTALPNVDPPSPEEGLALLERSSRRCEELGLVLYAGLAMLNLGILLDELGDPQGGRARFLQGLEYAKRNRAALHEHQAQYLLWWTSWTHGDWSAAFECVSHVRALADGSVLEFEVPLWFFGLVSSELDLGRAEQGREMLQRHADALDQLARPVEQFASLGVRLRTAASLGDDREADRMAASIAEAATPAPPFEHRSIVTILEADRYLVRRSAEGVDDRITACETALERLERHFGSRPAKAALLEARGLKAAAVGLATESATFFSRAADAWQQGVFPLREARARAAAAHALRRGGRDAEAASEHERAQTILTSLADQIPSDEPRSSFVRVAEAMLSSSGW